jgi:hypothetical protein
MNPIDFNFEKNSTLASKTDNTIAIVLKNPLNKSTEHTIESNFIQMEINHLLSYFELEGTNRELEFKKLLDRNKIPYIYTGQGPFAIEYLGSFQDKSKRSDFLVNLKNSGQIIFDVKCRKKIRFHSFNTQYFSVSISEIEELITLQDKTSIPLWLAFSDKKQIYINNETVFYCIAAETIIKFYKALAQLFPTREKIKEIKVLRIPNEILTKIKDEINLDTQSQNIDNKLLENFYKKNLEHNLRLKKDLSKIISKNKKHTDDFTSQISKNPLSFCAKEEIEYYSEQLMRKNKKKI